jgi:hypothetical protein
MVSVGGVATAGNRYSVAQSGGEWKELTLNITDNTETFTVSLSCGVYSINCYRIKQ